MIESLKFSGVYRRADCSLATVAGALISYGKPNRPSPIWPNWWERGPYMFPVRLAWAKELWLVASLDRIGAWNWVSTDE